MKSLISSPSCSNKKHGGSIDECLRNLNTACPRQIEMGESEQLSARARTHRRRRGEQRWTSPHHRANKNPRQKPKNPRAETGETSERERRARTSCRSRVAAGAIRGPGAMGACPRRRQRRRRSASISQRGGEADEGVGDRLGFEAKVGNARLLIYSTHRAATAFGLHNRGWIGWPTEPGRPGFGFTHILYLGVVNYAHVLMEFPTRY
jgi:hypothetical protein